MHKTATRPVSCFRICLPQVSVALQIVPDAAFGQTLLKVYYTILTMPQSLHSSVSIEIVYVYTD